MSKLLRLPTAFCLAATLLLGASVERAVAVTYKATIVSPMGYDTAEAVGISGTSIVGLGTPTSGVGGAFLLDDSTHSVVELNPTGWALQAEDVSGDSQVGHGAGPTTGGNGHAVLWHGTPASLVDLNPVGFSNTFAYGVSGNNQVGSGYGTVTGGPQHALLWHGSAGSVVDLNPVGFIGSQATGVFEDNVVGNSFGTKWHALLWHGTAESVVDLHPAAYPQTFASDASADSQVGTGIFSSMPGSERHALLWHGTAASVIDLQPTGFIQTDATGVAGALQVGYGEGTATGGKQHALLWQGSAASVVDLHSLLAGLGHTFTNSGAMDVNENGVIVGYAGDSNNISYAVKWTPVIPGDYNGNGIVDAADYTVWRDTLGSTTDLRANGDDGGTSAGKIDQADYAVWKTNFGTVSLGSGAGSGAVDPLLRVPASASPLSAAVPEPASALLLPMGFVIAGAFARRTSGRSKSWQGCNRIGS